MSVRMTMLPCPLCEEDMGWPDDGTVPLPDDLCEFCEKAAKRERAAIVAAARESARFVGVMRSLRATYTADVLKEFADYIERGEHLSSMRPIERKGDE